MGLWAKALANKRSEKAMRARSAESLDGGITTFLERLAVDFSTADCMLETGVALELSPLNLAYNMHCSLRADKPNIKVHRTCSSQTPTTSTAHRSRLPIQSKLSRQEINVARLTLQQKSEKEIKPTCSSTAPPPPPLIMHANRDHQSASPITQSPLSN
jgi:hypothetical protein